MSRRRGLRSRSWQLNGIQSLVEGFLGRDMGSARLRLSVVGLLVAAYWFGLAVAADFPRVLSPERLAQLAFPLNVLADFVTSFFAPQLLRHVMPILGGLYLAIRLGSHYLADMHELDSFALARRHMLASLFGFNNETLVISEGDVADLDHISPLLRMGGPGFLNVHLGFAVLLEDSRGLPKVYGPQGRRFVPGFERVRDVFDLRDQLRRVPGVQAVTADGVEIHARDVQMVFRVYGGEQARDLETPYPYTEDAIRLLGYGQAVSDRGPRRWTAGLDRLVVEQVETFASSLSFENLLALRPQTSQHHTVQETFQISRSKLTERFHTSETERRLREQGLELIWVGVGTWEVRKEESDASAGQALLDAWKIRQRLDLLATAAYQQRQRARGRRESTLAPLQQVVESWDSAGGGPQERVWSTLARLHGVLSEVASSPKASSDDSSRGEITAALGYLDSIIRPRRLDGDAA